MNPGMIPSRDEILRQALALDSADRAYVADELERSLPTTMFSSEDASAAWSSEIDRRIHAYDRSKINALGFDEVLDHTRKVLAQSKGRS